MIPTAPAPAIQKILAVGIGQFFIASTPCTIYEFAPLPGCQVQGQAGTVFSVQPNKTLVLAEGRLLAGAGDQGLDVQIGSTNRHVKLKGKTIAILDTRSKGNARITVLSGEGDNAAVVSAGGKQLTALATGQEAVMIDNVNSEEFIPADGVERQQIGASITKFGFTTRKSAVSINQLVRKEALLTCCFGVPGSTPHIVCHASWVAKRLKKMYGEQESPSVTYNFTPVPVTTSNQVLSSSGQDGGAKFRSLQPSTGSSPMSGTSANAVNGDEHNSAPETDESNFSASEANLQPIAYIQAVAPAGLHLGQDADIVSVATDHYRLNKGCVLAAPRKKLTIDTGHATIVSKPGSAVLIFADGTVTRVLDLHDWSKGDVSLIIDKHSYSLLPGNEVGVVKGTAKAEAARLAHKDQLGRRRVRILQVNADTQLVTSDFSVVDALSKFPLLAHLSKSTSAADRHLFSNIVKMAAVLSMTTDTTRGSYSRE